MIKKLKFAIMALMAMLLAACDNNDGMDSALSIYQQYEVLVSNGSKGAFANFRENTATGRRLELTDGSWLMINALTSYFEESKSETDPEFNYSTMIDPAHKRVIFTFHRSKDVDLVNILNLPESTGIAIPSGITEITNDVPIDFPMDEYAYTGNLDIKLVSSGLNPVSYHATILNNRIVFTNVPAGTGYFLIADVVSVTPTTQNDGNAGGSITLILRNQRSNITVN